MGRPSSPARSSPKRPSDDDNASNNSSSSNNNNTTTPTTSEQARPHRRHMEELAELRHLLELRDQEIRALKFELEKYKLALHQSQMDFHCIQQQQLNASKEQQEHQRRTASSGSENDKIVDNDNIDNLLKATATRQDKHSILSEVEHGTSGGPGGLLSRIARSITGGQGEQEDDDVDDDDPIGQQLVDTDSEDIVVMEPSVRARLPADIIPELLGAKPPTTCQYSPDLRAEGLPAAGARVVFKTGDDDDDDGRAIVVEAHDTRQERAISDGTHRLGSSQMQPGSGQLTQSSVDRRHSDNLVDEIIHDVGEIDLNLELQVVAADSKKRRRQRRSSSLSNGGSGGTSKSSSVAATSTSSASQRGERSGVVTRGRGGGGEDETHRSIGRTVKEEREDEEEAGNEGELGCDEEDEDIISDGLLTSLTDAAISNLSQLAALQERCESQQQQHSHHQYQQQQQSQQSQKSQHHQAEPGQSGLLPHEPATVTSPTLVTGPVVGIGQQQQPSVAAASAPSVGSKYAQDPFSASTIANQAAIAINAAAAAAAALQQQQPQQHQPVSSSSSTSPNSTIQADLSSSNSLASVVVAAAAAAAAANDASQQRQAAHHHHTQLGHHPVPMPPPQPHPQNRLISSALPSPDFYHSLHQHHQQAQSIQQQVTSLHHFSPSSSVTPSPSSSLMAQSRRSAASNTNSSSLMSPIASPNYLRRQFMPLLSPSPTSGLATASSSSGASSSLAHLLHQQHQHHQQQRSASALAGGPITSASSTPLSSTGSTAVSPLLSNKNSSQVRLNNMQIRHKFGYLGTGRAQFNSPHGFCLGLNQEIVVADTNNHRVCIFDKSGTYITQFGSPGKEEGQLWNPRKVAILHRPTNSMATQSSTSLSASSSSSASLHHQHHQIHQQPPNNHHQSNSPYSSSHINSTSNTIQNSEPLYVVCDRGAERSRMQLFTKDGAFIKKIGIHYIDIVAGLAITQNGLIIVVDSVSPTVYIINGETGILNGWFDCSGYMKEPSDIAVKSDVPGNEYFICDFKGHCVVVFSEQGEYLRKIGHDGLTSYPNGIDISDDGDILVGDSHGNRFHVVVFDRNGNFVSQFECPHVKVSRCCGLKITREGYIVTLAKNNHHVLVLDTIHI